MRRTAVVLLAVLVAAGAVFAQEMTFSGELKTGFYMEQEQIESQDPVAKGGMANTDGDSGGYEGRIRMDFRFAYQSIGLRVRFQVEPDGTTGSLRPIWNFAYAYGNLFDEQLTVSAGILGESPWGTGGPRLQSEPETREYIGYSKLSGEPYIASEGLMGVRFEYKPSFVPGLNLGFVLNQPDQVTIDIQKQTFGDVLGESVIGVAYEHDYFAVRVGYRFDSEADAYSNGTEEGGRLTYRLEERVLGTLIDGMQVWLNGDYYGIGGGQKEIPKKIGGENVIVKLGGGEYFINWLYWLWDAENFIAKFDTCFAMYKSYKNDKLEPDERQEYQSLEFLPAFYYKFFDNLLQAGLGLGFGMEFGTGRINKDSPYRYFCVEPLLRLNITGNAYVAAVYNYTDKYRWFKESGEWQGGKSIKHSVNIRAVYTF